MSEREWDKLLMLMSEGRVVPVIGPELLCIPWQGESSARLYDLWGQDLVAQFGIEAPSTLSETPLLYRIANQLSISPDMPLGDLEYELCAVINNQKWPLPESLRQLAEIRDFPLYITITIDHLMETALRQTRDVEQHIVFKLGGDSTHNDLPPNFSPSPKPTIFHLFGASCADPQGFAATEDALIEFSWALIDRAYAPQNLYDFLQRKRLLLLGCNFPDWLDRFFIHALTRKQSSQVAITFVSGSCPGGLSEFLKRKRATLWLSQSPLEFVAELHQRWLAKQTQQENRFEPPPSVRTMDYRSTLGGRDSEHSEEPQLDKSKHGAVFLSYAREDRAAAIAIRNQLESANIDTWMDESGLAPGVEFQDVIRDNIARASFFVAIISRSLNLEGSDRLGRFVLKEWKWAEDINLERHKDDHFLQPVVVDETSLGADFIDRPFRDLHWTTFRDGQLPPQFVEYLKKGIRRFRCNPVGATP